MNRIFIVLVCIANLALAVTAVLGWSIEDARSLDPAAGASVGLHFLVALGASILALLVHAVVLTYFMGTGRWIEETSAAYQLGDEPRRINIQLKYRVLPGMVLCLLLVIATGALGATADPAARINWTAAPTVHFLLAVSTLAINIGVSWVEGAAIARNGRLVQKVVESVRTIRRQHGLDADGAEAATAANTPPPPTNPG